ncbi:HET-domain-containing protein [Lentithecium fluviatile CBS 122367]|uniref:HET-domain-containing protein n=1 Tax=Lentithecium fluviatile CBS 122367 TaxID=1168545 RepID=A0A6G1JEV1_9PLEO|nr:HET-domain-containing protein [Lentithecium fluviatile CBS 122367]
MRLECDFQNGDHQVFTIYTSHVQTADNNSGMRTVLPTVKQKNHVQRDASSLVCLDLVRGWYDACCAAHRSCSQFDGAPAPTRLIAIDGNEDGWRARLVEHPEPGSTYAAVSHRWREDMLKTTRENLGHMLQDIPPSSLPRTFKDAIYLCTLLVIPYIWIDSICIIQHDRTDWEFESARMADTYQNACLVIAASAARDGFLVPRPNHVIKSHTFQDGVRSLEVHATPAIDAHGNVARHDPLSERGWTMQERLLARRFISFNEAEVYWECQSISDCECGTGIDGVKHAREYDLVHMLSGDDRSVSNFWRDTMVRKYSGRDLTFASDKLPAISAIAKRFSARLSSGYLAGLWEVNLLQDLAWIRFGPSYWRRSSAQIPSDYRSPSWSWTSINSTCCARSPYGFDKVATVVESQCILTTADEFGQVKSGFVVLRGPLSECFVSFPPTGKLPYYQVTLYGANQNTHPESSFFRADSPLELKRSVNACGGYQNGILRTNFEYAEDMSSQQVWDTYFSQSDEYNSFSRPEDLAKVWCLQILEGVALVLVRSEDSPDEFVRVGLFDSLESEFYSLFKDSVLTTVKII